MHNNISCTLSFEYVVLANLTLIGFNYRVNNRHTMTIFVEEISREPGIETVPANQCVNFLSPDLFIFFNFSTPCI